MDSVRTPDPDPDHDHAVNLLTEHMYSSRAQSIPSTVHVHNCTTFELSIEENLPTTSKADYLC